MNLQQHIKPIVFGAAAACLAPLANAELKDVSERGFTTRHTATIATSPLEAYQALTDGIRHWWDGAHTYSGSPENLYMEPDVGGCFCEILPSGGGVEHMHIVYADQGKVLRMTGALGPLQELPVLGSMTWTFKEAGQKTKLELVYRVGGYIPDGGMASWSESVDRVLGEQVARLKKYAEEKAIPVN